MEQCRTALQKMISGGKPLFLTCSIPRRAKIQDSLNFRQLSFQDSLEFYDSLEF